MTEVKTARRIGEPVFVVLSDGNIIRTAIKSLGKDGYGLFSSKGGKQFFDFDEAVDAAEQTIQRMIDSGDMTRKEEAALQERLLLLRTPDFRGGVFIQELIQDSQMMGLSPERSLGNEVVFPTDYFLPGQKVFGIVTPMSHYIMSPGWRPRPYFILKTIIEEVSFTDKWAGNLYYRFGSTHYRFAYNRIFGDKEAALQCMMKVFAEETGGTILSVNVPIFSSEEEEAYNKRQFDAMIGRTSIRAARDEF